MISFFLSNGLFTVNILKKKGRKKSSKEGHSSAILFKVKRKI